MSAAYTASNNAQSIQLAADMDARVGHRLLRGTRSIFMLRRFADREHGNRGHDPAGVRAALA
jgi:hypothetical protein